MIMGKKDIHQVVEGLLEEGGNKELEYTEWKEYIKRLSIEWRQRLVEEEREIKRKIADIFGTLRVKVVVKGDLTENWVTIVHPILCPDGILVRRKLNFESFSNMNTFNRGHLELTLDGIDFSHHSGKSQLVFVTRGRHEFFSLHLEEANRLYMESEGYGD